jgi:hypothetical protein
MHFVVAGLVMAIAIGIFMATLCLVNRKGNGKE